MKTKITIAFIILFIGAFLAARSQTLFTGTLTNVQTVETISNGVIIASEPLSSPAPTIVAPNGQVVPQAFIDALAQATGIPQTILKAIPLKYLVWLGLLAFGVPFVSRILRKFVPDNLQTGKIWTALKHTSLEINPVPAPAKTPETIPSNNTTKL